jgi:hypothetical protein
MFGECDLQAGENPGMCGKRRTLDRRWFMKCAVASEAVPGTSRKPAAGMS